MHCTTLRPYPRRRPDVFEGYANAILYDVPERPTITRLEAEGDDVGAARTYPGANESASVRLPARYDATRVHGRSAPLIAPTCSAGRAEPGLPPRRYQ